MPDKDLDIELNKLRIDKSRKRPRRAGWGKALVLLALLLLLAGAGYAYYARAYAPIEIQLVKAELELPGAAGQSALAVLTASGYVIPRTKAEISSQIIARVKDILVERGDTVQAGDVLLRLEDSEYAAQVRVAEAQLGAARARLAELRAGSRPEEKAAAKAAVASAEATLKQARLDLERVGQLAAAGVVPPQDLDRARTAHEVALASLDSARKNAELVELGPRQEEIDAAAAQERQAEAQLAYAKTQLDYTVIRAPIDGTILEKVAEKGELVTNINLGGTRGAKSAVVSMANLRDLQVEIDVNENDLPRVRAGQQCEIRLDSAPAVVIAGRVDEIAPQADRQKATVQVKVRLIDPPAWARPEVNARVTFLEERAAGAGALATDTATTGGPTAARPGGAPQRVWIPRAALARDAADNTIVYVVAQDKAVARKVTTGIETDKGVEVTAGLAGGESLIVAPLDKIADGARIVAREKGRS